MPLETERHLLPILKSKTRRFWVDYPGLVGLSRAYAEAAEHLAADPRDGGVWAFPALFLYRHAIELLLKAILVQFGPAIGIRTKSVLSRKHNLKKQLPDLEKIAEEISFEVTPRLKQLITRWDDEDPLGMKARSPIDLDGNPSRFKNAVAFDLKILAADCNSAIIELMHLLDECRAQERF